MYVICYICLFTYKMFNAIWMCLPFMCVTSISKRFDKSFVTIAYNFLMKNVKNQEERKEFVPNRLLLSNLRININLIFSLEHEIIAYLLFLFTQFCEILKIDSIGVGNIFNLLLLFHIWFYRYRLQSIYCIFFVFSLNVLTMIL